MVALEILFEKVSGGVREDFVQEDRFGNRAGHFGYGENGEEEKL